MKINEKIMVDNANYREIEITKTRFICKRCKKEKRFDRLEHIWQHLKQKHNIQ